ADAGERDPVCVDPRRLRRRPDQCDVPGDRSADDRRVHALHNRTEHTRFATACAAAIETHGHLLSASKTTTNEHKSTQIKYLKFVVYSCLFVVNLDGLSLYLTNHDATRRWVRRGPPRRRRASRRPDRH